jgi:hypothetical protein
VLYGGLGRHDLRDEMSGRIQLGEIVALSQASSLSRATIARYVATTVLDPGGLWSHRLKYIDPFVFYGAYIIISPIHLTPAHSPRRSVVDFEYKHHILIADTVLQLILNLV